ncbi:uncharacterized protein LOC111289557 isoform X2 [Durio zibethinus]|uniref:Uncharacterized protein LOC111289557 isoform X2 n=1 Tax=Durio zibethinus TaxID=66656 RepID=A0A6P5Y7K5_DURZI|nr:uncharacterized protein LOC111289557 isoform X2 [Durio zibethinus]
MEALNPSRTSILSHHSSEKTRHPMEKSKWFSVLGAVTVDASPIPQTTEADSTVSENLPNRGNAGYAPVMNGQNQPPTNDREVKGKKKSHFQGRGKGFVAMPKGRGSAAPGWTGAGFDVDART